MPIDPNAAEILKQLIDPAANLLGAIIGAGVAYGLTRRQWIRDEIGRVADSLDAMATSVSGMAGSFEEGKVPYEHGNTFVALVRTMNSLTNRYLGEPGDMDLVQRSEYLAHRAANLDVAIENGRVGEFGNVETVIADLRRLAGILRARAVTLRMMLKKDRNPLRWFRRRVGPKASATRVPPAEDLTQRDATPLIQPPVPNRR